MVKKSENLNKSQKITFFSKNHFFFVKYLFKAATKKLKKHLHFLILGLHNSTRVLQSSQILKKTGKNHKKSQKIMFFCHKKNQLQKEKNPGKKQNSILFVFQDYDYNWTRTFQSSPFQNPGGEAERYGQRTNERTEFLVSNIEYKVP